LREVESFVMGINKVLKSSWYLINA
jgi:hypothetical protein